MAFRRTGIFLMFVLLMEACGFRVPGPSEATGPVIVYKTKKDYRNQVSVQLSENGRSVIAFPGPGDVLAQRPVELRNGYLLKKMVGNAYTSLTIEEYAVGAHAYTAEELLLLVIDRKPFLEIYECGECTGGDTASINQLILQDRLKECKSLR